MFEDDGMEHFLVSMVTARGDELAFQKAQANGEYSQHKAEKNNAWDRLSGGFTDEQRKAYIDFEAAEAAVEEIIQRYFYLQGLRDGIALSHVV